VVVHHVSGTLHPVSFSATALGCVLLVVYVIRALMLNEKAARRWLAARGLVSDERNLAVVRRYLWRLRWSRVAATLIFVALGALSAWALHWPLGFVTTPYLLCILIAESLSPAPRRGRVRSASMQRRSRSYFAPVYALAWARCALWSGAVLGLTAPFLSTQSAHHLGAAVTHGALMLVAAIGLEVALDRLTRRALPDRTLDLQIDTALRVASARIATAAGLGGGMVGLLLSVGMAGQRLPASMVTGQVITLSMMAAAGVVIALLLPLRSWHPRAA
jgi:hypothetical protein